jgi:ferric-dicitrate binding protein FerR (iron transport regulator)
MAGDTVVAGASAVRIRFADGTVVNLGPRARVAVEKRNQDLSLRLVNGYLSFNLSPDSGLRVYSGNTLVPALPGVTVTASAGAIGGAAANDIPVVPGGPPPLSRH